MLYLNLLHLFIISKPSVSSPMRSFVDDTMIHQCTSHFTTDSQSLPVDNLFATAETFTVIHRWGLMRYPSTGPKIQYLHNSMPFSLHMHDLICTQKYSDTFSRFTTVFIPCKANDEHSRQQNCLSVVRQRILHQTSIPCIIESSMLHSWMLLSHLWRSYFYSHISSRLHSK